MPSTDRRLELKEKTLMAQNTWQASVYANGLVLMWQMLYSYKQHARLFELPVCISHTQDCSATSSLNRCPLKWQCPAIYAIICTGVLISP